MENKNLIALVYDCKQDSPRLVLSEDVEGLEIDINQGTYKKGDVTREIGARMPQNISLIEVYDIQNISHLRNMLRDAIHAYELE